MTETLAEWDVSATETSVVERSHGGMPRWSFLGLRFEDGRIRTDWPYWSNVNGQRFLTRFIVAFTPVGGLHVTRIHGADDQREWPHDHSRTFWSLRLLGSYDEDVWDDPDDLSAKRHRRHRWLSLSRLGWDQAHSITRVDPLTVTLLVLGRKRNKSTYWTPDGKTDLGMRLN